MRPELPIADDSAAAARAAAYPVGATATIDDLEDDPHALLARLREHEPVSWLPALGGWLVTSRDLALRVMRDGEAFTVDDPRFSTGRVVGPSMLTLDGPEHDRHRAPFARPFHLAAVRERFDEPVATAADGLVDAIDSDGQADLRGAYTGPLAAAVVTRALGLEAAAAGAMLEWYGAIVESVTRVTAGGELTEAGRAAFADLRAAIERVLDGEPESSLLAAAAGRGGLARDEVVSNAAVLLFGGIETTDGMIANAVLHLLERADALAAVRGESGLLPNAIEESLRLEPAAATIDRYATRDVELAGAPIRRRELVVVSIAGANRDPGAFRDPDRFDVRRENARQHIAFAHGPHVCVGMHLARREAQVGVGRLLARLPRLRLDPTHPAAPRGLVFRKPPVLRVRWD